MRVAFGEIRSRDARGAQEERGDRAGEFSIAELVNATQLMSQTGGVDYHVIGEVTAATPGGSFTRPYKGDGHFDNIASLRPR